MTAPILAVPSGLALAALAASSLLVPAHAGPVLCTTTLEAPIFSNGTTATEPVEITRCGVTTSPTEVVENRFYTYTQPYARGVNLLHQFTDTLGIALGGKDGTKVMGLGFPDQTIVWDGSAITNTVSAMMSDQIILMPLRTSDVPSGYNGSLASEGQVRDTYVQEPPIDTDPMDTPPIRGLW